jgi:hypothetical protein
MTELVVEPGPAGSGQGISILSGDLRLAADTPLLIDLRAGTSEGAVAESPLSAHKRLRAGYETVEQRGPCVTGRATIAIPGAKFEVVDTWTVCDGGAELRRVLSVRGSRDGSFGSGIMLAPDRMQGWIDVEPFVPGVAYGNAPAVAALSLAGAPARAAGVRTILIREDRMSAPMFTARYPDGAWVGVIDLAPEGATTIAEDGAAENGDDLIVDERMRFISLGGRTRSFSSEEQSLPSGKNVLSSGCQDRPLEFGAWCPGSEGEITYSSGGLPLTQLRSWRRREHPIRDGLVQEYRLGFRVGSALSFSQFVRDAWAWAWGPRKPTVNAVDVGQVVQWSAAALASQVVTAQGRTGVPLESDSAVAAKDDLDRHAVMGFVGANTDAAYALIRASDTIGGAAGGYRPVGEQILDSFACLPMDPPAGEGFDTVTGEWTTYRRFEGADAVYARSLAEGALAALDAVAWDTRRGMERPDWASWATRIGQWLVSAQAPDGSLPRAWEAGTGRILDASRSAAYAVVPFLVSLAASTGETRFLDSAARAGEFAWAQAGETASYAGATLDNPDVVDKEAAILSAEAFLALYDATGERRWLDRALSAASVAETWTYLWDVPMPEDADDALLHWKKGVPTTGHQLIATGVSMTDGFLAVNASVYARLFRATADPHHLDLARILVHGTTSMLALPGRTYDLRGPGWQQEHWSFSPRRGFGLNRRWLPWVPVAHVRGIHRIEDLGPELAHLILGWSGDAVPVANEVRR